MAHLLQRPYVVEVRSQLKLVENGERRQRLRTAGLCETCGKTNDRHPKWYCSGCSQRHLDRQKGTQQARYDSGLCRYCPGGRDGQRVRCPRCRTSHEASRKRRGRSD